MKNKNNYFIITVAFLCMALLGVNTGSVVAQREAVKKIIVQSVVTDDAGNPVENVEIFSGSEFVRTDADGKFSIPVEPDAFVVVKAKGFSKRVLSCNDALNEAVISLESLPYGEADINLAFRKTVNHEIIGAVSHVNASEVNRYSNTPFIEDGLLTGRALGMLGNNTIRGLGIGLDVGSLSSAGSYSAPAMIVVDGLPRDLSFLRTSEIESITVLKDANASVLYGTAAVNGVIMVTTKRGEAHRKRADFSANYGIATPKQLPEYLNSAEYMKYYNRARENDGLSELYNEEVIRNYESGNPYRYPSVDYYSSEYLKPFKSYFDLNGELSGGNQTACYYANLGWHSMGDLYNFGNGKDARRNIFNIRTNADLKINSWINASLDGSAVFYNNKMPNAGFWSDAANIRPHEYTPLLPIDLINPENALLAGRKYDVDGKYLLGGNTNRMTNSIASVYAGGESEDVLQKFSFNNRINIDFDQWLKGLSFHTNISFDYLSGFQQTIAKQYSVYEPVWDANEDKIVSLKEHGKYANPGTQVVSGTYLRRRFGFYGLLSYDRRFDAHHFTGSLVGYGSSYTQSGDFQGVKRAHLGLQLAYTYNNRYMVDFSGAYVNSVKLAEGHRGGFAPSAGLAWVVSSEDFMQGVGGVDFLKLRVSAGNQKTDLTIGDFFYYDSRYAGSSTVYWDDGNRSRNSTVSSWGSNTDMGYGNRKDFNIGLESRFFGETLGFEANLFHSLYDGIVIRPSTAYPSFYNSFIPFENFNANVYNGFEIGLNFTKTAGDWSFFAGANLLYVTSERTKVDEVYLNDYRYRQGRPIDAYFGLEAVGFFKDQNDIDNSALQTYGNVRPGDIKYKDRNSDGFINADDETYLGHWQAPFTGGLQIKLSWRNLTLYAMGEGRTGHVAFTESNYYWVDGNKKYTEVVRGSWTSETGSTATYPRLTTQTSGNNSQRSTFWRYSADYFSIRKMQLTYGVPESFARKLFMKELNIFVDAYDPVMFAKKRRIMELNTGGAPQYRTFSIGLKAAF
ncbi:SusC/RagA family TonB-linked outer membrane protein [Bacteroidia bacterium]|nr:SusC/RagA family TonB-linked outer membrane protein [Bacteroidia bacterium]